MVRMQIRDFSAQVFLGWEETERQKPQEVRFFVDLVFPVSLRAQQSDELSDTICYDEVCGWISRSVAHQSFRTVEHLFQAVREDLRKEISKEVRLQLKVHKVLPPVPGLLGGVIFGDEEACLG